MKLFALLALMASACSSPTEVDEIQQDLTYNVYSPFGQVPYRVYVGFSNEPMINGWGGPYTGALFVNTNSNDCWWERFSTAGSSGVTAAGTWGSHGGGLSDYLEHVGAAGAVAYCAHWNTINFNANISLTPPKGGWSTHFQLYGEGGDDIITCNALVDGAGAQIGVNGCFTGPGNNAVVVKYGLDNVTGDTGVDLVKIDTPNNNNVGVALAGGNDCLTWTNGGCPAAGSSGGAGTDSIKSLSCGGIQFEAVETGTCGF